MFPEEPERQDWRSGVKEKMKETGYGGSIKELRDYTLIEESYTGGCLEGSYLGVSMRKKKAETRRATLPGLWSCKKNQPIQKDGAHEVLLAKYEQRSSNHTGEVPKMSTLNGQGRKLLRSKKDHSKEGPKE